MRIREMLKNGIEGLTACDIDNAENDARLLAMYVLDIDYSRLLSEMNTEVADDRYDEYIKLINKRKTHYPCQYIIGTAGFMGYEFEVAENVLIPRPETELLVEKAVAITKQITAGGMSHNCVRALDMCTGTGCIGISYSLYTKDLYKHNINVTLSDISEYAIALATRNNDKLNAACSIVKSDLFENIKGTYNIIMSNPPYIRSDEIEELMEEVKCFEPHLALDGTEDGLYFYRRIIKEAREYLDEGGYLLFEIGYDQYEAVQGFFVDNGYRDIELIKDYAGLDRIVLGRKY